jgi:hypothetical protein
MARSENSPPALIGDSENGVDTMKANDLQEIGFVRQKKFAPHLPETQPVRTHLPPDPTTLHANSFNPNGNGFVCPTPQPARSAPPMHKSAQIARNRQNHQPPATARSAPCPPCFSPRNSSPS